MCVCTLVLFNWSGNKLHQRQQKPVEKELRREITKKNMWVLRRRETEPGWNQASKRTLRERGDEYDSCPRNTHNPAQTEDPENASVANEL